MAHAHNIQKDLETFIEYQQVMKTNEIVSSRDAKQQVFETYEKMLLTKEGKKLVKEHFSFKVTTNLASERSFIEKKLPELLKHTHENKSLQRNMHNVEGGLNSKIREESRDLAMSLTLDKLHPAIKNHPEKLKHALGVLTRVQGISQEQNRSLTAELSNIKNKMTNLIANLVNHKGIQKSELEQLMDNRIELQVNKPGTRTMDQGMSM